MDAITKILHENNIYQKQAEAQLEFITNRPRGSDDDITDAMKARTARFKIEAAEKLKHETTGFMADYVDDDDIMLYEELVHLREQFVLQGLAPRECHTTKKCEMEAISDLIANVLTLQVLADLRFEATMPTLDISNLSNYED